MIGDRAEFSPQWLLGMAALFRSWPQSEMWGRPQEAEKVAQILEEAHRRLTALNRPAPPQGKVERLRGAVSPIVAHFNSVERDPSTGELDPPLSDEDGICIKVGLLRTLRAALVTPESRPDNDTAKERG